MVDRQFNAAADGGLHTAHCGRPARPQRPPALRPVESATLLGACPPRDDGNYRSTISSARPDRGRLSTMDCPSCGSENRDGAKFCVKCGAGLAAACPTCGASFQAGDAFCAECGTQLAQATPTPAPPAAREVPAAERRLVSVLFADLVGFTTLSESRDSEEVRELLSSYFEL